jgi:hypothetical protein
VHSRCFPLGRRAIPVSTRTAGFHLTLHGRDVLFANAHKGPLGKVPSFRQAALAQNCQPVVHVGGGFRKSFTNFTTGNGYSFGGKYLELISNERFRYTDKCR